MKRLRMLRYRASGLAGLGAYGKLPLSRDCRERGRGPMFVKMA